MSDIILHVCLFILGGMVSLCGLFLGIDMMKKHGDNIEKLIPSVLGAVTMMTVGSLCLSIPITGSIDRGIGLIPLFVLFNGFFIFISGLMTDK